jgi:hypothetical protein
MRTVPTTVALVVALLAMSPAVAQQLVESPPDELQAGHADLKQAEVLNNSGQRGPDSEACALISRAMSHFVKAAAERGAPVRVVQWTELYPEERKVVGRYLAGVVSPLERYSAFQKAICKP